MNKTTEAFEAWWADIGEQSLFALNTTTDDDIKILAGIAWEAAIREALANPEITTPDVCGEVCARAKLCYGCGKSLDEANAKLAEPYACEAGECTVKSLCAGACECLFKSEPVKQEPPCWCRTCRPITLEDSRMIFCPDCGNKRCPKATDHRLACTNNNEPGQPGSAY